MPFSSLNYCYKFNRVTEKQKPVPATTIRCRDGTVPAVPPCLTLNRVRLACMASFTQSVNGFFLSRFGKAFHPSNAELPPSSARCLSKWQITLSRITVTATIISKTQKKCKPPRRILGARHCCHRPFRCTIATKNILPQGGFSMAQLEIRITAAAQKHITENGDALQLMETRDSRLG